MNHQPSVARNCAGRCRICSRSRRGLVIRIPDSKCCGDDVPVHGVTRAHNGGSHFFGFQISRGPADFHDDFMQEKHMHSRDFSADPKIKSVGTGSIHKMRSPLGKKYSFACGFDLHQRCFCLTLSLHLVFSLITTKYDLAFSGSFIKRRWCNSLPPVVSVACLCHHHQKLQSESTGCFLQ